MLNYKGQLITSYKDVLDIAYSLDPEFYEILREYGVEVKELEIRLDNQEAEMSNLEDERDETIGELDEYVTAIGDIRDEIKNLKEFMNADGRNWDSESIEPAEAFVLIEGIIERTEYL